MQTLNLYAVCATLGELDETYKDSWVKHNPNNPDVTTNIRVQALLSDKANKQVYPIPVTRGPSEPQRSVVFAAKLCLPLYFHDVPVATTSGPQYSAQGKVQNARNTSERPLRWTDGC